MLFRGLSAPEEELEERARSSPVCTLDVVSGWRRRESWRKRPKVWEGPERMERRREAEEEGVYFDRLRLCLRPERVLRVPTPAPVPVSMEERVRVPDAEVFCFWEVEGVDVEEELELE